MVGCPEALKPVLTRAETQPVFLHPYIWESSSSLVLTNLGVPFNQGQGGRESLSGSLGWALKGWPNQTQYMLCILQGLSHLAFPL